MTEKSRTPSIEAYSSGRIGRRPSRAAEVSSARKLPSDSNMVNTKTTAILIPLALAGCGSSSLTGPGGADSGADHAAACTVPVDNYCAGNNWGCTPTWADVEVETLSCTGNPFEDTRSDCGPYHVRELQIVEVGAISYYDSSTGALVAIIGLGMNGGHCQAGPSDFVIPTCSGNNTSPVSVPCSNGGGGGTTGAGGTTGGAGGTTGGAAGAR